MNIFEENLNKITTILDKNKNYLNLSNLNSFKGVTMETPH